MRPQNCGMALIAVPSRDRRLIDDVGVEMLAVDVGVRLAASRQRPLQEGIVERIQRRSGFGSPATAPPPAVARL